jgi:glycosyltransferase involved in cell wall biosynthesis
VGTLQPRKNITTLINGFYHFKKTNPEFKLVIAGKKGWMYENVFKEVEELGLSNDIVFPGFLPDEDIITLYKHAFCFVMPSLYEGFGIPVLEAMSHGCPVISSYASSLPEVGGEASMYFDPTNADDLAHNLHILNSEKGLREELVKKGHERVKSFSWNKCAEETLKVILNTV